MFDSSKTSVTVTYFTSFLLPKFLLSNVLRRKLRIASNFLYEMLKENINENLSMKFKKILFCIRCENLHEEIFMNRE